MPKPTTGQLVLDVLRQTQGGLTAHQIRNSIIVNGHATPFLTPTVQTIRVVCRRMMKARTLTRVIAPTGSLFYSIRNGDDLTEEEEEQLQEAALSEPSGGPIKEDET